MLSTDNHDFTDVCYAKVWYVRVSRHQGNQGYQWLKINVDARRALSIVFLNLRSLLIELMFATHWCGVSTSGKSGSSVV